MRNLRMKVKTFSNYKYKRCIFPKPQLTFCAPASSEGEKTAEVINCEFELVLMSELPAEEVCLFGCLLRCPLGGLNSFHENMTARAKPAIALRDRKFCNKLEHEASNCDLS